MIDKMENHFLIKLDKKSIFLTLTFKGSPDFTLRALSPLTFLQRLKDFDAVISVVGTPAGQRSDKGKEERKWVYARASKMHLPYKGAEPRFGPQINHTAAALNGGSRMAKGQSLMINLTSMCLSFFLYSAEKHPFSPYE